LLTVPNRLNANHNTRTYDIITIRNGLEVDQQPPTRRIRVVQNTTQAVLQRRVGPHWQDVLGVAPVTRQQLVQFVAIIQQSYIDNQHRGVLQQAQWRALYHVGQRVLSYLGQNGLPLNPAPMVDTVACADCGLVLPLRNIDIDHQRPFAGNDREPVCKVFRAMGLTVGGPDGHKGQGVVAAYMAQVGGLPGAANAALGDKYTLNDRGEIFYTLVNWAGKSLIMEERCRNHIINLRPLCGACNTPNRNTRHF
jgi:hypothetical protein